MALTTAEVAKALGLSVDGEGALSEADKAAALRLVAASAGVANAYAPDAPNRPACEAVLRTAAYLADLSPTNRSLSAGTVTINYAVSGRDRDSYGAALRNSGAASLLNPYKVRRAGAFTDEDLAPSLAAVQDDAVIRWRLSDGSTRTLWNSNA